MVVVVGVGGLKEVIMQLCAQMIRVLSSLKAVCPLQQRNAPQRSRGGTL